MRWSLAAPAARRLTRRRQKGTVGFAVLAATLCLGLAGAGSAAPTLRAATFTGYGFESCNAPTTAALTAWLASPYRAVGIYIGGVNRSCANTVLTADWVSSARAAGWSLIPTYVGLQAPCFANTSRARFTAANAQAQGLAAADDAIAQATRLGLPGGSPIYFDMEAYPGNNPACTQAVRTFVSAWTTQLHAYGYLSGVYGSAASTARDMQALAGTPSGPDDLWFANWNGVESVFGDPYVSDALWANHKRIHQYRGGHQETWGGVTINIDNDYVDGDVVGPTATIPPSPPAPVVPGPAGPGFASSGDGLASATWPAGALDENVDVALMDSVPGVTLPGYSTGGYGVELTVTDFATLAPVRTFAAPVTLTFAPRSSPLAPVYSTNGTVWKRVPQLVGDALAPGAETGYTRGADGGFAIQTTVAGFFALVPDRVRPSAPPELAARFAGAELALAWRASSDLNGPIAGYRVTLRNAPVESLAPDVRRARMRGFHRAGPSVYRVVAVDAAGNLSAPSKPVVVLPSARPRNLPKAIPAWAWRLSDWQLAGRPGTRPKAPRIVPAWYWRWAPWRALPFHLR